MATIPRSNAGQRVVRGVSVPQSGLGEAQAAVGRAVEGLAQTGFNMAVRYDAQQRAEQEQERRRQQALDEAQARQRDALTLASAKDELRITHDDLADRVQRGEIAHADTDGLWTKALAERTAQTAGAVREGHKEQILAELTGFGSTLSASLRRVAQQRQRSEVRAGVDQQLELLSREYEADPIKATATAMKVLETQGAAAGMTPEVTAKTGQAWREQTQFALGTKAVSAGRSDPAALAQAEKLIGSLPDLDPQRKASLLDRVQVYRLQHQQQAEMRAQRAERENERRMRQAEAEFQTFQTLADKGTVLDPAYVERVQRATAGTPYQQGIVRLAQQAVQTGGLAAQPVERQRAALQALDAEIATRGRTPELDARREQVRKVLAGAESDIKADPLNAALERGVVARIEPLNLQGGIQGLGQQLQQRSLLADTAAAWAGRPVSPLTSTEAQSVAQLLSSMPADQKATGLQLLASQMTPQQAQALALQIDSKDRALGLALVYGAARTTEGRPTGELILKGQEALKAKTIKMDDQTEVGLTASLDAELRGAITNPQQLEMARDAAKLIWAGYSADSGRRMSIPGAVKLAVGGEIVQRNGAKVIIPAGVTESQFEQHLEKYPAQALQSQLPDGKVYVRGQPVEAAAFLASLPSAPLRTVGRGRYAVLAGGAVATNAQGRPILVEAPGAR